MEIAAWAFEASGLPGPGMPPLPKNYDNLDQKRPDVFHKLVLPDRRMNPQVKVRKIKKILYSKFIRLFTYSNQDRHFEL